MKRVIALTVVLVLMVAMLAACGATGKYYLKKSDGSVDNDNYIELKGGGKVSVVLGDYHLEGEWKQSGDKITMTIANQDTELTLKGNELSDGYYTYVKK